MLKGTASRAHFATREKAKYVEIPALLLSIEQSKESITSPVETFLNADSLLVDRPCAILKRLELIVGIGSERIPVKTASIGCMHGFWKPLLTRASSFLPKVARLITP